MKVQSALMTGSLAARYLDALLRFSSREATSLVMEAVDAGMPLADLYIDVFQVSQWELGRLWEEGSVSVGQEHYCTNATQVNMATLYPRLFVGGPRRGQVIVSCVEGEHHELGTRMLADFFEMEGWDTIYLGANTPTDSVVSVVEQHAPDLVAIGMTLPDHVDALRRLVAALDQSATATAPVIVGGAGVDALPGLWQQLGVAGTARGAREAIEFAHRLVAR